ncbi:Probable GTP-binding protein EngB [Buchnera aphidicola (Thelaxes suberi)]|uniref:ribosome biogenesis GTP-binding protein YihA/YsxC n=1 Tax=Buchnera aphidicola TaxID=9 RepID=UPI003463878A
MVIDYYQSTFFYQSITNIKQLKTDNNDEIAFIGYSNSGKSSIINTIINKKKIARTSKSPGNTRTINFFKIQNTKYLVDLPGYGYANIAKNLKIKIDELILKYLHNRKSLKAVILIVDIRRCLRCQDYKIINLLTKRNIPILILLSKSDKLSKSMQKQTLNYFKKNETSIIKKNNVILFSCTLKIGMNYLQLFLKKYYKF